MIVFPNAKINLGLAVTGKRPDGYHNIETIFYPVPLEDALELTISKDGRFDFTTSGLEIEGKPEENLCVRAWKLMENNFATEPVNIHLHKAIPAGAGLGGGSSDAAFMIRLVNDFFGLGLSVDQMQRYARQTGADCAFFIENKPIFAYDRGDQFREVDISLKGYFLVIVKPEIGISTAWAYRNIIPKMPVISFCEIIRQPVPEWKESLFNDFEKSVFARYPEIGHIKTTLYEKGAVYASMTGSGSAVFGIFDAETDLHDLIPGCFYWAGWL